ncbi:hypothetical protein [Nocardiopsis sp. FR4]|uniref:hypothetical protein n=1 Tax=Nocardiopsis sp. FR4 TaxID=2605985 RepID=UPI001357160D|nr:hypothetical protein [Nocardiopsis sp. FR4]
MSNPDGNAVLINSLSSSLRSTLNGLDTAPNLIRRVLKEGSWQSFTTPRGEQIKHTTFESFITTAPTAGLGKSLSEIVRVIGDDKEILALLAEELGTTTESLLKTGRPTGPNSPIELDARDFGSYARSGGWIFGLMVARSVKPGSGNGHQSDLSKNIPATDLKVSANRFALLSGTTAARVMRFYRAWERAAEAGLVPEAASLNPGQEVDLPASEEWAEYFTKYEQSTGRREGIAQQAEAAGTSYTEAMKVAKNPAAMRTAILGDSKTAEAAHRALMDRMEDDTDLQATLAHAIAKTPELRNAVSAESKKAERIDYIRRVAIEGTVKTPAGETLEIPPALRSTAQEHLSSFETKEEYIPAESTIEAYEAVKKLVSESIEADPDLSLRERRAKLYGRLQRAAKVFEDFNPDDLSSLNEPDIVEVLHKLHQAISACLESASRGASHTPLHVVNDM